MIIDIGKIMNPHSCDLLCVYIYLSCIANHFFYFYLQQIWARDSPWEDDSSAHPLLEEAASQEAARETAESLAALIADEEEEELQGENVAARFNPGETYEKSYVSLSNLDEGVKYPIIYAIIRETRYGEKPIIKITHQGEAKDIYLSPRYLKTINAQTIEDFNAHCHLLALSVHHRSPWVTDVKFVKK